MTQPWACSCRPTSVVGAVGRLFDEILLTLVLREINDGGQLRDEQFRFRPRQSTTLQLVRFIEKVNRNFDERRLPDAVFLDVGKVFDTAWVKGHLHHQTAPTFTVIL
jgi:hypothetical protein